MSLLIGVVTFPGSLDDRDAARALRLAGGEPVALWHDDDDIRGVEDAGFRCPLTLVQRQLFAAENA